MMGDDIYENIFIGNFIYTLGVRIGIALHQNENIKEIPACVNLLQQTPMDKPFGDMLASFEGVSFLIEFKNKKNKDKKEPEKRKMLYNDIKKDPKMGEISLLAHWLIQINVPKKEELETKVVRYLDMDDSSRLAEADSFDNFIEKIVTKIFNHTEDGEISDIGVSEVSMSKYLTYIKKLFSNSSNKPKKYKLGGLIMTVAPDGGLKYVVLNDITKVLNLKMSRIREQGLENTQGLER